MSCKLGVGTILLDLWGRIFCSRRKKKTLNSQVRFRNFEVQQRKKVHPLLLLIYMYDYEF